MRHPNSVINDGLVLEVIRGWRYQPNHKNWRSGGTTRYYEDGRRARTLSMGVHCQCGEALFDGDMVYDSDRGPWMPVHVNCVGNGYGEQV